MMITATPTAEENSQAADSISRMLVEHQRAGGSPVAIAAAMLSIGASGVAGIVGTAAIGPTLQELATRFQKRFGKGADDGSPDEGEYVARVLDQPAPGMERTTLMRAAMVHAALSLAALCGADPTAGDLESLAAQIRAAPQFRGRMDWN